MSEFEDFLIAQSDVLEQLAYELLWRMAHPGADFSEADGCWDMAQIGPLLDCAARILNEAGLRFCRPYFGEEETPCFLMKACSFTPCPMLETKQNGGNENEGKDKA